MIVKEYLLVTTGTVIKIFRMSIPSIIILGDNGKMYMIKVDSITGLNLKDRGTLYRDKYLNYKFIKDQY